MTRWDIAKPPTLDNLILASADLCAKHEKEGFEGMDIREVCYGIMYLIVERTRSEDYWYQCLGGGKKRVLLLNTFLDWIGFIVLNIYRCFEHR